MLVCGAHNCKIVGLGGRLAAGLTTGSRARLPRVDRFCGTARRTGETMRSAAVRRPHPEDLLGAFALDACSPAESATVAAHVVGCPSCTTELDQLAEVL